MAVAVVAAVVACVWTWWAARPQDAGRALDLWAFVLVVVAAGALAGRRVAPLLALAVTLVAAGVHLLAGYPYGPVLLCVCWAMFEVARRRPVRVSGIAAVIAALVSMASVLPRFTHHLNLLVLGLVIWGVCWLAVPWALGALVYVRGQSADRERRDLVARAVLEERIRVSREVHDVAGHGFAVVAMQAGVALVVLDEQPDQVRASLEAIRSTSTGALEELRRVLRDEGSEPGLAGLAALAERAGSTGLSVELRTAPALEVPAEVGALVYRVVRESLTNVLRHAAATTALITVARHDGVLSLSIADDGSGPGPGERSASAGSGIAGMRGAVEAAGGTLTAGPARAGFEVRARIPLPGRS